MVVVLGYAVLAPAAAAASNKPATIKDLESQQVDVSTAPPQGVDNNKTMDSYKRFLDLNAGDAALREEALRRLGDLNLESSESERIERELATNEGLRATEAIHLYTALLKAYPNYERNDSVLYQLARAYELNAQPDKALAALDRLVTTYRKSRYIDEAQFRRGEILFSEKAYPAAQAAYEAVIEFGALSPFYNQSLYKHGWSLFKQGESERSLQSFAGVLDSVLVSKANSKELIEIDTLSRPNRELVEDTFRVMSITFSYADGPKTIDEFVKHRKPRPYYYLLYCALGRSIHREGALHGRRGQLSRLRIAGSQQREGAAIGDAGHRGLLQGWLPAARPAGQKGIRRELQLRYTLLAGPNAQGRAQSGGRTQDQSERRRAVLPCGSAAQ